MSADAVTETHQEPIDLLTATEGVSAAPTRWEYVEEMAVLPALPDHRHNKGAFKLAAQLDSAGLLSGMGNGYRAADKDGRTESLVVPDFYALHREPTGLDESYRTAHQGWYPIDMVALVGEVTSLYPEGDTGPKLRSYAAAGVPIYILINRNTKTAHCYTAPVLPGDDPKEAYYDAESKVSLGNPLALPAPYPTLDTAPFLED